MNEGGRRKKGAPLRMSGIAVLFGVLSAGAGYLLWRYVADPAKSPGVISVRGGEAMEVSLPGAIPHYLQGDPRWGEEEIGGSGERIANVGCTLCSVAMGLEALGHPFEPGALNAALIGETGYTERGWMIWSAVGKVTGGKVEVVVESAPRHDVLDRCLKRGWSALVKFYLPGNIPHWVLVVGKRGDDYLVKDPAYRQSEVVALSERARGIYSVRYLRPTG